MEFSAVSLRTSLTAPEIYSDSSQPIMRRSSKLLERFATENPHQILVDMDGVEVEFPRHSYIPYRPGANRLGRSASADLNRSKISDPHRLSLAVANCSSTERTDNQPPNRGKMPARHIRQSTVSAQDSYNPDALLQVSNEYVRVVSGSRSFRSLLSRPRSLTGGGEPRGAPGFLETKCPFGTAEWDSENGNGNCARSRRSTLKSPASSSLETKQATVRQRLRVQRKLYYKRCRVADYSLIFAFLGITIAVLDGQLCANGTLTKEDPSSNFLRFLILGTTITLTVLIILYYAIEVKLAVIDSGADDWRVAINLYRIFTLSVELFVCSLCPLPGTGQFCWPNIAPDRYSPPLNGSVSNCNESLANSVYGRTIAYEQVEVDVILTIPMFLRCYLLGRYMVLHSHLFQDAATRTIAALNRVSVDFKFVMKTKMMQQPLAVLISFAVTYWVSVSWLHSLCENYVRKDLAPEHPYLTSLWFVIITFMTIGYGDVVPRTYCGRTLAIVTGIMGAGVSSALIAVISRKLDLTRAEKHVNAFMADSNLAKHRKNAAASVLQETWRIYKLKFLSKHKDELKIRLHQRRFIAAITEFRRVKWEQRKLTEQSNMLIDIAKVQTDMSENLWALQQSNELLLSQVSLLSQRVFELQIMFGGSGQSASDLPALVVTLPKSPVSFSDDKTVEEVPMARDANQNDLQRGKLVDRSPMDVRLDVEESENQPLIDGGNSRVRLYNRAN